jgi:peptide-methionine (S)-S-oxide reductase
VGYAGGEKENPTYHQLGDHTETLQIDYDPDLVTYSQLLDIFWESHNPTLRAHSRQYRSVIFHHDSHQEQLARQSKAQREAATNKTIHTSIEPFTRFYPAEDYHQKYYLQNTPFLLRDIENNYADFHEFVHSTSAARLNGYAAGYNSASPQLQSLGLSPKVQAQLASRLNNRL